MNMFSGRDGLIWWQGIIEAVNDPEALDRARQQWKTLKDTGATAQYPRMISGPWNPIRSHDTRKIFGSHNKV